jgi:hypothetical protein
VLPSLHGVPRDGSPTSSVLRSTPPSCCPSRAAPFPSLRGTAAAPWVSFPQPQSATAADLELFTGIPKPDSLTEATGPPRFLENPNVSVPCSSTPAGPLRSATATLSVLSSAKWTTSTPTIPKISGLNHTARPFAVYASQGGLPHRHARLASGWLASLVRAGMVTRWVLTKGFMINSILLSQASPGAPK